MKNLGWMGVLTAALLTWSTTSLAELAHTSKNANLRAGPAAEYPVVAIIQAGTALSVEGCQSDFEWCDVVVGPYRGWLYAANIAYPYQGANVPVLEMGAALGIGITAFSLGSYWDHHYGSTPWYPQRQRWIDRPRSSFSRGDHGPAGPRHDIDRGPHRPPVHAPGVTHRPRPVPPSAGERDHRPRPVPPGAGEGDRRPRSEPPGVGKGDHRPPRPSIPGAGSGGDKPPPAAPSAGTGRKNRPPAESAAGSGGDKPPPAAPDAGVVRKNRPPAEPGAGSGGDKPPPVPSTGSGGKPPPPAAPSTEEQKPSKGKDPDGRPKRDENKSPSR